MTGVDLKLLRFMEGSSTKFVIPVYQRTYDWKIENCKQLYDDLVKIIKYKRKSHFFGSIVAVFNANSSENEFLIIDGQQRLTTINLLLLAIYNNINQGIVIPKDEKLGEKILYEFIIDKWNDNKKTRLKLKPIKKDDEALQKLFEDDTDFIQESNITLNYKYFYRRIQRQEISIDELFEAINSLLIIQIKLNDEDNPQLIFESLNSTGLDLSEADKIRNYILMGLQPKEQNQFYEKYWQKIEEYTKPYVSEFIRDYLSLKQKMIPSQKRVYIDFKDYSSSRNLTAEQLCIDILPYAKRYSILLHGDTNIESVNKSIYRLNRLETSVIRPFFLEVLRLHEENVITEDDLISIFNITESYIFRRVMVELPTNVLNKLFLVLHSEITNYNNNYDDYLEKFKYALATKKENARFPNDSSFTDAIANRQIYSMNSKNKVYILERFENFGTKETHEIYSNIESGVYSIEHIMPQHLSQQWINSLGSNYDKIHQKWLHKLANLTLTAYNVSYSNNTFHDKKTMKNGYKESGLRLNRDLCENSKWTEAELESRAKKMIEKSLEIWPFPHTTYEPPKKEFDSFTLGDDFIGRGKIITKFAFRNIEQPVGSWSEMFNSILLTLYSEDKSIITKQAYSDDGILSANFVVNTEDNKKYFELDDGVFVLSTTNTQRKLTILAKLFDLYQYNPDDLVFFIRDYDQNDNNQLPAEERRKKYWSYALEKIQNSHGGQCFHNVNPSKSNWIIGTFGISGFGISCVANYDRARVELSFSKNDGTKNKKAFDRLFKYKNEIEQRLGTLLSWERNDDAKSSRIYIQLSDVSIEREQDWDNMSEFHAKWSKLFYDIIVPYLK